MIPVSAAFREAVQSSHDMAARARVCTSFQTGTDPDGAEVELLDGGIELDATAPIRGTGSITVDDVWPTPAAPLLLPYGNELFLERGVLVAGVVEWCPLGYFRIDGPDQDDAPDGPIVLEIKDRMSTIKDSELTGPRAFPAAMTYGAAVADLVLDVYPAAVVEWDDTTSAAPLGRDVLLERDRHAGLRDLVAAVGKIAYWNHEGKLRIETPLSTSAPVAEIRHGAGGALVKLARQISRQGVFNGVVAEGESANADAPVRALRVDNNPDSPTYWSGRFGQVSRRYSSPLLTTVGQAGAAADTMLRESVGLPYTVDFRMVPNPALQPWDPVAVTYDDGAPAETHVLQRLTIPLTSVEGMAADTRQQSVVIIADG